MQQNNYIEAEDAYRRALVIAPDNNKMCNLGICLMKQGRVNEAKDTLRRVKPAVADGPRGVDSHLKAYERAQQMLRDLESVLLNKGGSRLEQSKLFDAFLSSSAIWQPQPCKEHNTFTNTNSSKYADENMNSNIIANHRVLTKSMQPTVSHENLLNIRAPPFYTSKIVSEPTSSTLMPENLKRTRSGNAAHPMRMTKESKGTVIEQENMTRKQSNSELLPNSKDFEQAIIAAALNSSDEILKPEGGSKDTGILPRKIDKRLKVFQDITLSLSPRA